jgi:hypothetical protein
MELQLTFSDPIWVSQNTKPCFVKIDFKDGLAFVSSGLSKPIPPLTVKRLKLKKQLPKNSPATAAIKALA